MSKIKNSKEGCLHLNTKNVESWKMPNGNSITEQCVDCLAVRGKHVTSAGGVTTGKWFKHDSTKEKR